MKHLSTLLIATLLPQLALAQSATSVGGGSPASTSYSPLIWNQFAKANPICQDPFQFFIGAGLNAGEAVANIKHANNFDSISTTGLRTEGELMTDKGAMTGVRGEVSMDNYAGQAGEAVGNLAVQSGYHAAGNLFGVHGSAIGRTLDNYGSGSTSRALGGYFSGGADPSDLSQVLSFNAGTGTWYVGGTMGELRGTIDSTPSIGALAGVIGVDSNQGSATSYAGYFEGDVLVTGDVFANSFTPSSRRWKSDVETIATPLETLEQLRGVRYTWTESGEEHLGFIAEEVAEVLPELVAYDKDGETVRGVAYGRMSALLVESVKSQQDEIQRQADLLEELQREVERLRDLVE